jgi:hypothetical protein
MRMRGKRKDWPKLGAQRPPQGMATARMMEKALDLPVF